MDTTDDTTDSSWRQRCESTTWGRDEVFESTEASFDRLGLNYPNRDPIRYQCPADVQYLDCEQAVFVVDVST